MGQYCIESFEKEGLPGVGGGRATEIGIRGLARQKNWDLAFVLAGKPRLLVSLKSILANIGGSIPNRIDDLMGEVANVQQLSPELVIGYVVIMDEKLDSPRRGFGSETWIDRPDWMRRHSRTPRASPPSRAASRPREDDIARRTR